MSGLDSKIKLIRKHKIDQKIYKGIEAIPLKMVDAIFVTVKWFE